MGISKVVYGTTTLVDLTSDTVDAAHLAKGRTAHDAAGNLIVGTLEQQGQQQESGNLLEGITPSLLNGATKSGKAYVIPSGGGYGTDYIEYQLNIPTLMADTAYCLIVYAKTDDGTVMINSKLFRQSADGSTSYDYKTGMYFKTEPRFQSVSFSQISAGARPTKLLISGTNSGYPLSISSITLMAIDA